MSALPWRVRRGDLGIGDGTYIDVLTRSPDQIDPITICRALSRIRRWGGKTITP